MNVPPSVAKGKSSALAWMQENEQLTVKRLPGELLRDGPGTGGGPHASWDFLSDEERPMTWQGD